MNDARTLAMSSKELNRLQILSRVVDPRLTQAKAAEQLGMGIRQLERLCRKLRIESPRGLVSKRRGRTSNWKLPDELREQAHGLYPLNESMRGLLPA